MVQVLDVVGRQADPTVVEARRADPRSIHKGFLGLEAALRPRSTLCGIRPSGRGLETAAFGRGRGGVRWWGRGEGDGP